MICYECDGKVDALFPVLKMVKNTTHAGGQTPVTVYVCKECMNKMLHKEGCR